MTQDVAISKSLLVTWSAPSNYRWTNAEVLLIRTLGTNYNEISSEIQAFAFNKMHLKMLSAKWQQFCHSLNVLIKYLNTFQSATVLLKHTCVISWIFAAILLWYILYRISPIGSTRLWDIEKVLWWGASVRDVNTLWICDLWPLLLTWFNFNPSMDK